MGYKVLTVVDNMRDKFAELIVRECMEQVWYTREDVIKGNNGYESGVYV